MQDWCHLPATRNLSPRQVGGGEHLVQINKLQQGDDHG